MVLMPTVLKQFLENLSNEDADTVWEYLDSIPDAPYNMIVTVVDSHPSLRKRTEHSEIPQDVVWHVSLGDKKAFGTYKLFWEESTGSQSAEVPDNVANVLKHVIPFQG